MHVDDCVQTKFLTAAIQKRKQAAGVVSMPMRYHDAFNWPQRRSEARQIAGKRFGVRTGVEEGASGCGRVRCLICFLVDLRQQFLGFGSWLGPHNQSGEAMGG
jgi:hypothetical protein